MSTLETAEVRKALEESPYDVFSASDIAEKLGIGYSKSVGDKLEKLESVDEIGGKERRVYSTVGDIELDKPKVFQERDDMTEVYQKAVQIVKEFDRHEQEVKNDFIQSMAAQYIETKSLSSNVKYRGVVSDLLKQHPNVKYEKKGEKYSWRK